MNRRVLAALLARADVEEAHDIEAGHLAQAHAGRRLTTVLEAIRRSDLAIFERLLMVLEETPRETIQSDLEGAKLLSRARERTWGWYESEKHQDLPILEACKSMGMSAAEALDRLADHARELRALLEKRALYEPATIFVSPKRQPPVRASDVKLGESVRLDPGQSILFEGGVELRFPSQRLMSKEEAEAFARAVRAAKGDLEPPPEAA